jgi:hypothetical protein
MIKVHRTLKCTSKGGSLFYDPPMCHGESHPAPEKEKEDTGVRAAAVLGRRHAGLHMALYREAVRAAEATGGANVSR